MGIPTRPIANALNLSMRQVQKIKKDIREGNPSAPKRNKRSR